MTETDASAGRRGNDAGLLCSLLGIAVAIIAVVVFDQLSRHGAIAADAQTPLAYLVTWVPLAGSVIVYWALRRRAARATLRLGILWIDVLWGAAIGIACRMIAIGTNLAVYGSAGLGGAPTIAGAVDPWLVFGSLIAPIVIAPVIEETFFRGLALGSLYDELGGPFDSGRSPSGSGRGGAGRGGTGRGGTGRGGVGHSGLGRGAATIIAIAVTTVLFTAVHLIGVPTGEAAITTAVPVFVLGAAAGAVTLATGRIGAAIIGHIVFNGIAAVIAYPW